jgi:predicted ATPase/class 3 adenylate cyclase
MRRDLPSGTVTFLFTDIEGSTKLLNELGAEAYAQALNAHRHILRQVSAAHQGVEVDTQGDAFFMAFPTATDGVRAASEAQKRLAAGPIRVRMGLHTGMPHLGDEGYVGHDVHKGARIASSAHGGQVVVSRQTKEMAGDGFALTDLGEHRVKDFADPVWIFQLGEERFPPLKTISNTNLPRPASSFVGRDREVREVASLLREGVRLLTLTGPGGTGKTRLSIEAAAELVPEFKNGVFWVGLATLRDHSLVADTVAQTIGGGDGLAEHIGERQMLLVLDNLEQVIASAPELASLVEACPNLGLLVTSRELLRVRGEVEYPVPHLVDPEAVELFCDRSRLSPPNKTISELCRRLDNLPLAIELAAARASVLTPAQILDRLSTRLDLLKGGRDADARQATLRATVEWSHDLLTDDEKLLFARLAVFRGGCTLEAAEEIAEAELDILQSLVDKSLLRHAKDRFWMLETIGEYAAERFMATGEAELRRSRHADFMRTRYAELSWKEDAAWIAGLEAERDNLRASMRWALDAKDSDASLLLATAYAALCKVHGPLAEGRAWLDAALQIDAGQSHAARAKALLYAASLAEMQRDADQAEALGEASLSMARRIGDSEGIGRALLILGYVASDELDYDKAESLHREALAAFRESGNDGKVRVTLGMLGFDAIARRNYEEARRVLEEALVLSRDAHDSEGVLIAASNLGHVLVRQGRLEDARLPLRESVLLAHEQSDVVNVACQLEDIAGLAAGQHDCEQAAVMLGGAAELREATGFTHDPVGQEFHEEIVSNVRRDLDGDRLRRSWEQGRKMSLDELVVYALGFLDPPS